MFEEIAADYSHIFVRFMERVLRRLWTRIYDGVIVAHADTIAGVAAGNELVYVPCHRSTMDDVLMPYAIYSHGYAVPHIAAGINLNLPVVGPMLRKGGAFFMRRSFRGSALYSAVFTRYLGAMMARGHPIQYFIEGGRSRTGRSLAPKTGMLSMTVRSYLRQPVRPIMFVPVYIGYERVMEVDSYVGELSGKPKEKETLLGFLRSLQRLRENFGHVHVNIGEPIALAPLLDAHQPEWRDKLGRDGRGAGVAPAVDALAQQIMRNIHAAAAVTPVNLLATVMLATPRQVMRETDLQRQLALYLQLLRDAPYSDRVTITALDSPQIIAHGLAAGILVRVGEDVLGLAPAACDLDGLLPQQRAAPGCAAVTAGLLLHLQQRAGHLRPAAAGAAHLSLHCRGTVPALGRSRARGASCATTARAARRPDCCVRSRRRRHGSPAPAVSIEAVELSLLAQPTLQTIERYYLAIALLLRAGSGAVDAVGAGKALPADGAAHGDAVRLLLAGVLRSLAVRGIPEPAASARRAARRCRRQAGVRRSAGEDRRGCAAGAIRAAAPQHPAAGQRLSRRAASPAACGARGCPPRCAPTPARPGNGLRRA